MLTRTIEVSEEVYNSLSNLTTKNNNFNNVIEKLLENYEDFSDEQAEFYNQEIERIENGIYENVTEITLSQVESEIKRLEKEIKDDL